MQPRVRSFGRTAVFSTCLRLIGNKANEVIRSFLEKNIYAAAFTVASK